MAALPTPVDKIRVIVLGLVFGALARDEAFGEKRVSAIIHEHLRLAQSRPAELQNALRPLLTVIADPIAAGIGGGQLRACDPALQARLIYNLIATTLHTELLMEELGEAASERRRRLADEIWEFCRRAIIA